jgi:hypothetical protein
MIADVDPDDASRSEAEEVHHSAILARYLRQLSASQSRTPERLCPPTLVFHREYLCRPQRNLHKCIRNVPEVAGVGR